MTATQGLLFPVDAPASEVSAETSSTFTGNMVLPVHRWFRYSAGFSAQWASSVIRAQAEHRGVRVFDPFAGSGTTLLAAEANGCESWGIDPHPFVYRVAKAKLAWRTDLQEYRTMIQNVRRVATNKKPNIDAYPRLIRSCYDDESLAQLDCLRQAYDALKDETPASELVWLTLVAILRKASKAGTAQWQYVLPKKRKRAVPALRAFDDAARMMCQDMEAGQWMTGPRPVFTRTDARTCEGIPKDYANMVVTSPPYPNNFDYADATRLEMSFMGEVAGWGDLHTAVRQYLIRSCSQHVPEGSVDLGEIVASPELQPIHQELSAVCSKLAEIRESKGGRKTYHFMVACYFRDLALTWKALRGVCQSPSTVCFVIGDSAPYGVYVPVIPWLGKLALAAGFTSYTFEKTRDRNIKWKNRKHRVPLQEGRLWVEG